MWSPVLKKTSFYLLWYEKTLLCQVKQCPMHGIWKATDLGLCHLLISSFLVRVRSACASHATNTRSTSTAELSLYKRYIPFEGQVFEQQHSTGWCHAEKKCQIEWESPKWLAFSMWIGYSYTLHNGIKMHLGQVTPSLLSKVMKGTVVASRYPRSSYKGSFIAGGDSWSSLGPKQLGECGSNDTCQPERPK